MGSSSQRFPLIMLRFVFLVVICIAALQSGEWDGYGRGSLLGYGDYSYGYGDVLADGQNFEVNYSGPKANPIVAKYSPSSYDHGHGYGKPISHGNVHDYAHNNVLAYGNVYGHGSHGLGYGYSNAGHGYAPLYSGSKGYNYAEELPTVGGVGYVTESKPTGFLYKNARYIGHGSPYVPFTAPYKQTYAKIDRHYQH